jgi:UDP-hydrolysing UDP-N-acetyl-D-glucosamine 2-epimerase
MRKALVFIGSRSNYGRLYQLIMGLRKEFEVSLCLACTAVDLVLPVYMSELVTIKIRADMRSDTECNMSATMALVALQMQNYLANNKFDVAICHGDRFETLGFAVACSFANLPLVHMEAGEFSGNIDNRIRWAISALSDLRLAPTVKSAENLAYTSPLTGRNYFVGSPAVEYVLRNRKMFFKKVYPYILVVYNPTNSRELDVLFEFLDLLYAEEIVWINPNIDPGNKDIIRKIHTFERSHNNVQFEKNLSMDEYLIRLANCKLLVGNTSSGIKEAAALEKWYLMFPNRQTLRETDGNVIPVRSLDDAVKAYEIVVEKGLNYEYRGLFGYRDVTYLAIGYINKLIGE